MPAGARRGLRLDGLRTRDASRKVACARRNGPWFGIVASAARETDLLIVAAHSMELSGFLPALGKRLRGELGGLGLAAAGVGVGAVAAGIGTAQALIAEQPRALILVGSCGFYPGAEPFVPGRLFVANATLLVDASVLAGRAAFPGPMTMMVEADAELVHGLASSGKRVVRGALATTLGITTDAGLARDLAHGSGCEAENLEALAVGLACRARGVAFAGAFGCTNEVGPLGRQQWAAHHELAAGTTAELVLNWVMQGAPGLPPRA